MTPCSIAGSMVWHRQLNLCEAIDCWDIPPRLQDQPMQIKAVVARDHRTLRLVMAWGCCIARSKEPMPGKTPVWAHPTQRHTRRAREEARGANRAGRRTTPVCPNHGGKRNVCSLNRSSLAPPRGYDHAACPRNEALVQLRHNCHKRRHFPASGAIHSPGLADGR